MRVWILVLCLGAGCGGEEDEAVPRQQQCERLREHLVDLRLRGAQRLSAGELEQHRLSMTRALGEAFLSSCAQNTGDAQLACMLAAQDSDTATECTRALGTNQN